MENMITTAVYQTEEVDLSGVNEFDKVTRALKISYLVLYSVIFVFGASGNGVVIWATGFKMKKTVNTVWYLNLAVADFFVTAFLPFTIAEAALDFHWPFGQFMCKVKAVVFYLNMHASINILVAISVDRCVCVVWPAWAQNHRSVRKASWVSLGIWVLAVALSFPYFSYRDVEPSTVNEDIWCWDMFAPIANGSTPEEYQVWKRGHVAMIFTRFLMGFVVPFTAIVSCYSVILYRLRRSRSLAGRLVRPFKIMVAVITSFFLCWAPYHVIHLIHFVNALVTEVSDDTLSKVIYYGLALTIGLALLNSCLNPLLYVFMGRRLKDFFRRPVLKVLEKAFAEDPPQTKTYTNPGSSREDEIAMSETQV